MSSYARQSQASPSISLEKGAYRMRAPRRNVAESSPLRRRTNSRVVKEPPMLRYEKQMAILVVFLICATMTSFGAAYYLFTTRWDKATPPPRTWSSDNTLGLQVIDFNSETDLPESWLSRISSSGSDEKYLAYLPHSGFHNQRIAFENALVLSRLLNRTLLIPPVRLGNEFQYYAPFDVLQQMLIQADKRNWRHCGIVASDDAPEGCVASLGYTHVPWDWLVDLSEVRHHQHLLPRWNFTDEWLQDALDIGSDDMFVLADSSRDMYGFQDFISLSDFPARKYQYMIHLSTLALREERLIQLGTLFGSSRLHLRNLYNLNTRKSIRQSMAHLHPHLVDMASSIQQRLGSFYLGAHVRLGDGIFEENARRNSRLVWWKLVHDILGFSIQETLAIERRFSDDELGYLKPPADLPLEWELQTLPLDPQVHMPLAKRACKGNPHAAQDLAALNTPLFVSSDASVPEDNLYLSIFLRTFPCIFFLSDFPDITASLDTWQSSVDGLLLKPFLLPFVDALVASRAQRVVGTEGSTYSRFVEDVLWRTYHGQDIAQKG
ncbi:hypothetical protein BDW22DRAFT_1352950 [Trametopsis cervina]|nr:hypothetical protein BDW22DRAFT_1352950 [Trametopsis cervina]